MTMQINPTVFPEVLLITSKLYKDSRGHFLETWREDIYAQLGIAEAFVQDNLSFSHYGVLRGLHFQASHPQGKLVFVPKGEIFDVVVDIRQGSPFFGRYISVVLSDANAQQLYIPPGFAHGFCVLSEFAVVSYKCTNYYSAESERRILWNDPQLDIHWPISDPMISPADKQAILLKDLNKTDFPAYIQP